MKRTVDIIFSMVGLIILLPLLLIVSIIILVTMGSPIFFIQERIGKDGVKFNLYKFRTMSKNQNKIHITNVTTKNDPRITKIGKILRKSKIDEIPGLFNVFLGQMSLVGPRPEVEEYISKLSREQKLVLSVKPGLTCPATLKYINEEKLLAMQKNPDLYNETVIFPDKIKLNLEYAKNSNLTHDFMIIFQTILLTVKHAVQK